MHFLTKLAVLACCILPVLAQTNCSVVRNVTVVSGDTLTLIADRNNVTLDQLLVVNSQITNRDFIVPGQNVSIPNAGCQAPQTPPQTIVPCVNNVTNYTVVAGDTFFTIATQKLGRTLQALEAANPDITNFNLIFAGQVINVPPCPPAGTQQGLFYTRDEDSNLPGCLTQGNSTYTVVSGDSLTSIAHDKLHIKLQALKDANSQIANFDVIFPGQVLNVPICKPSKVRIREGIKACVTGANTHTVQDNESLQSIADDYGLTLESLLNANPQFTDSQAIKNNDVLNLPACPTKVQKRYVKCPNNQYQTHTVTYEDYSMTKIANKLGLNLQDFIQLNLDFHRITNPDYIKIGQELLLPSCR